MSKGEFLTRVTIWLTLAGYFAATVLIAISRDRHDFERYFRLARLIWSVACVSLLVHVAFAYHFYHHWSQESVYRETARQTADVTGINWGGGVYFNYVVMAGWIVDAAWWWRGVDAWRKLQSYSYFLRWRDSAGSLQPNLFYPHLWCFIGREHDPIQVQ